jgi:hypothetical protein
MIGIDFVYRERAGVEAVESIGRIENRGLGPLVDALRRLRRRLELVV